MAVAERAAAAANAIADTIDDVLETIKGPGDVPRLGALIQCFVTALKDHSFTDFEDFETSMKSLTSEELAAARCRLHASEQRWRQLLSSSDAAVAATPTTTCQGAAAPALELWAPREGKWINLQKICAECNGVLLVWLRHFG